MEEEKLGRRLQVGQLAFLALASLAQVDNWYEWASLVVLWWTYPLFYVHHLLQWVQLVGAKQQSPPDHYLSAKAVGEEQAAGPAD